MPTAVGNATVFGPLVLLSVLSTEAANIKWLQDVGAYKVANLLQLP